MPTLNGMTAGTIYGMVPTSGFTTRFWKDYRSSKCKGSGVAKHLEALAKFGMTKGGSLDGIMDEDLSVVIQTYRKGLREAFVTAKKKATTKKATHSAELCQRYINVIDKEVKRADKRLKKIEKEAKSIINDARGTAQTLKDLLSQLSILEKQFKKAYKFITHTNEMLVKAGKSELMEGLYKQNAIENLWKKDDKEFNKLVKNPRVELKSIIKLRGEMVQTEHPRVEKVAKQFDQYVGTIQSSEEFASRAYQEAKEVYDKEINKLKNN